MIDRGDIILDSFSSDSSDIKRIIDYYEKYRLLYNVAVGISGAAGLILVSHSFQFIYFDFFVIIVFGIMANIMYTMSWAGTILAGRILIGTYFFRFRMAFIVFGTLFSMLVSFWAAVITI